jgi:hypothetical protein
MLSLIKLYYTQHNFEHCSVEVVLRSDILKFLKNELCLLSKLSFCASINYSWKLSSPLGSSMHTSISNIVDFSTLKTFVPMLVSSSDYPEKDDLDLLKLYFDFNLSLGSLKFIPLTIKAKSV